MDRIKIKIDYSEQRGILIMLTKVNNILTMFNTNWEKKL